MALASKAEQNAASVHATRGWGIDRAANVCLQTVFELADRMVIRGARQPKNVLITRAGMAAGDGAAAIPEHVVVFAERV
jgi:hypothetical protein